jgi:predicted dehydrogenase
MIGMGKMNQGHLGNLLSREQVQVVALSDVESGRLADCRRNVDHRHAERFGVENYRGCRTYGFYRELLARPDLDGIVIATPNHWHGIMAVEALRAGKDVYCEKPLTMTIGEARLVADTAREYNRVFQVGSQQRSDRAFRFACELARNGRIGRIHTVHVSVGGPPRECYLPAQPTPETLDWNTWLGPAPWRPYHEDICPLNRPDVWANWRSYRDYAGGGMTDFGAHHYGMDHTGPVEVHPPDGKEYKLLTYVYANGVRMTHGGTTLGLGIEFVGDEGRVAVDRGNRLETRPESVKQEELGPRDVHLYESRDHMGNWLECVRNRAETICPAEIGARTATVCHIGNIAYWLDRPLGWDPVSEHFVRDPQADRLLRRPMRAPWQI